MAYAPQGHYARFGWELPGGDPENVGTWGYYDFSNEWAPGRQSTEGWAPGYYTDNSTTFENFMERAVLGGLLIIGGASAAGEGGALSGGEYADTSLGRTSLTAQEAARWGTVQTVKALGVSPALAKLIGRFIVDDDWGYSEDTGDVWGEDTGGGGGPIIPDFGSFRLPVSYGGGQMTPAMASFPGAAMAAGRSLWSVLRAGGARFSTFIAANGVRARLTDLWPAVRKYGGPAVAGALGIGLAELGQMLMQSPTGGRRKRGRGISAADIRRAKRVIRFNTRLSRELGTNRRGGGRARAPRRRSYRYC